MLRSVVSSVLFSVLRGPNPALTTSSKLWLVHPGVRRKDGIYDFAGQILQDCQPDFASSAKTIFHAFPQAQTRYVPTERLNPAFHESHALRRRALNNAWKCTNAIETDLVQLTASTTKPVLQNQTYSPLDWTGSPVIHLT